MSVFKAYDIRGVYPSQINPELGRKIGLAFAGLLREWAREAGKPDALKIAIGRDARPSGVDLAGAVVEGVRDGGVSVVDIGVASTPALYHAVGALALAGGIIVTASHNPPEYNGMKFTREDAIPLSLDTGIGTMRDRIEAGSLQAVAPDSRGALEERPMLNAFHEFVLRFVEGADRKRIKAVIDTANGVAGLDAPLYDRFNLDVVPLYFELDGTYPNHEANPVKAENIADCIRQIAATQADIGIAFDGDADRAVLIDEQGRAIRPDLLTALIAAELLKRQPGAGILYDLRSSWIVRETIERAGGRPIRDRVGHAYMKATMRREGCIFGGELSGHYYWQAAYTADAPLLSVITVLNLMRESGKPLSELIAPYLVYHATGEINFHVDDKDAAIARLAETYKPAATFMDRLDGITIELGDWWFNVRASNTEPLLRLNLECKNADDVQRRREEVQAIIGGTAE